MEDPIHDVLAGMLGDSHFLTEDEVPGLLVEHGKALGARDVALYLVDYE